MKKLSLSLSLSLLLLILVAFPALADGPMVGEIRLWSGPSSTIPAGWEIADGADKNTSLHSNLFAIVGYTYGGSGSTFKLPNLRGRVAVGYDTTGADSEFDTLGESGGEKRHTLTINEMPSHTHVQDAHSHTVWAGTVAGGGGGVRNPLPASGTANVTSGQTTATNQYTGAGQSHNVIQPYLTLYYIIYTGVGAPTPTPTHTPSPTPTHTPTPTSTPMTGTTYLPNISVYTNTLDSGKTLTQPVQISFGQIIISGLVLATVAVVAFQMAFGVVFKR